MDSIKKQDMADESIMIKEAFDMVHADEGLKNRTRDFLSQKTNKYSAERPAFYKKAAAVCLLFIVCITASGWIYFTPASVISIDINPSLELNINCFDRVISVRPYNDDGYALTDSINVRFMKYQDAVVKIMDNQEVSKLLEQDEMLSIVVVDSNEKHCRKMLSNISSCASGNKNTVCHSVNKSEVENAHEHGMSYGKYEAFLKMQEIYPDITLEEVKQMHMKEIHDCINGHHGEGNGNEAEDGYGNENDLNDAGGNHGHGNGHHHGRN